MENSVHTEELYMQDIDLRKERRWENTVFEQGRFLSSFLFLVFNFRELSLSMSLY